MTLSQKMIDADERLAERAARVPVLRPVDSDFFTRTSKIASTPIDAYWSIDQLLAEIGDLLGRCLGYEEKKKGFDEKRALYWLSYLRDKTIAQIRIALEADGENSNAALLARLEREFLETHSATLDAVRSSREAVAAGIQVGSASARERIELNREVTAYLSPRASDDIRPLAESLERNRLGYEERLAEVDRLRAGIDRLSETLRQSIAEARQSFYEKRTAHKANEAARELEFIEARFSESTTPESPLNYDQLADQYQSLFDVDFGAAIVRAQAIERFLALVSLHPRPLPELGEAGALFALIEWSRAVAETFSDKLIDAHNFSWIQPFRQIVGDDGMVALTAGEAVTMDLREPAWAKGFYCGLTRLRIELSATSAAIRLPVLTGALPPMAGERVGAPFLIGDLREGDMIGQFGVASGRKLSNASPWGSWTLQFVEPVTSPLDLELHLSIRMIESES